MEGVHHSAVILHLSLPLVHCIETVFQEMVNYVSSLAA